jgi:hypothetical protein
MRELWASTSQHVARLPSRSAGLRPFPVLCGEVRGLEGVGKYHERAAGPKSRTCATCCYPQDALGKFHPILLASASPVRITSRRDIRDRGNISKHPRLTPLAGGGAGACWPPGFSCVAEWTVA